MTDIPAHQILVIRNQSKDKRINHEDTQRIRQRLQGDIEDYLANGGKIQVIPSLESERRFGVIF